MGGKYSNSVADQESSALLITGLVWPGDQMGPVLVTPAVSGLQQRPQWWQSYKPQLWPLQPSLWQSTTSHLTPRQAEQQDFFKPEKSSTIAPFNDKVIPTTLQTLHFMIYLIKWSPYIINYSCPTCCFIVTFTKLNILYFQMRGVWSNDLDNKDLVFLGISPLVDAALCLHCIRWAGREHLTLVPCLACLLSVM